MPSDFANVSGEGKGLLWSAHPTYDWFTRVRELIVGLGLNGTIRLAVSPSLTEHEGM
eukprot:gene10147-3117_t